MLAGSLTQEDEDAVLAELEAITQVGVIWISVGIWIQETDLFLCPVWPAPSLSSKRSLRATSSFLKFLKTSCQKCQRLQRKRRSQVCSTRTAPSVVLPALCEVLKFIRLFQRKNEPERSRSVNSSLRRSSPDLLDWLAGCWTSSTTLQKPPETKTGCRTRFPAQVYDTLSSRSQTRTSSISSGSRLSPEGGDVKTGGTVHCSLRFKHKDLWHQIIVPNFSLIILSAFIMKSFYIQWLNCNASMFNSLSL